MAKSKATHAQAQLLLQLYDLRREPRLREARAWFGANFHVRTPEEAEKLCPSGSENSAFMRMMTGYWEQACLLLNHGLLDPEQFFTTSGEFYMVWQRLSPIAEAWRGIYKNPHFFGNLEKAARKYEKWSERRAPGSIEIMKGFVGPAPQGDKQE